jgi:hypothetical protein
MYYFVSKFELPFITHPLWFKVEYYLTLEDISRRFMPGAVYSSKRVFFSWRVAKAYDTRYFRKETEREFKPTSWSNFLTGKTVQNPHEATLKQKVLAIMCQANETRTKFNGSQVLRSVLARLPRPLRLITWRVMCRFKVTL